MSKKNKERRAAHQSVRCHFFWRCPARVGVCVCVCLRLRVAGCGGGSARRGGVIFMAPGEGKKKKEICGEKKRWTVQCERSVRRAAVSFFCCFSSSRLWSVDQFPTNPQNSDVCRASLPLPSSLLKCWSLFIYSKQWSHGTGTFSKSFPFVFHVLLAKYQFKMTLESSRMVIW